MRLSAIVPATNGPPTLGRCLDAIRSAEGPPEEVIVVEQAGGPGPAAARNAGAARATGDVLVFVDADVLPHEDAFVRIRAAFEEQTELIALFGSYDDSPPGPGAVSGFRNLLHHHVHQRAPGRAETFWAGLGAIRREPFLASGGFDASRFRRPSVEDIELGGRLHAAGALLTLDPQIQGTHLKTWTLAEMVRADLLDRGAPWLLVLLRDRRGSTALNLGWRYRLSTIASVGAVAAVAGRRPVAALGALGALVCLNARFYDLLLRRRGPAQAVIGVGLHAVHHITAGLSVPVALGTHLLERRN